MEVLDHEPGGWFLVKDGDVLLLDAHCSHGAVDYSVAVQLDDAELRQFAARGHDYLTELADAIHMSAPGVHGSTSPFKHRAISPERSKRVDDAIRAWLASSHPN